MNRGGISLRRWLVVNWLTNHIKHAAQGWLTNWYANWATGCDNGTTALKAISTTERNGAHCVLIQVLGHLKRYGLVARGCVVRGMQGIVNRG